MTRVRIPGVPAHSDERVPGAVGRSSRGPARHPVPQRRSQRVGGRVPGGPGRCAPMWRISREVSSPGRERASVRRRPTAMRPERAATGESMNLKDIQQTLEGRLPHGPGHVEDHHLRPDRSERHAITCSVDIGRALARAEADPGVGGPGGSPCSGDMLLGALAACAQITCQMVAASIGVPLGDRNAGRGRTRPGRHAGDLEGGAGGIRDDHGQLRPRCAGRGRGAARGAAEADGALLRGQCRRC